MLILYLVRHAKSDWDNNFNDHDRPLNERGLNDAPNMGKYLAQHLNPSQLPQYIICSTAKRAHTTAQLIAQQLGYPPEQIATDPLLYDFSLASGNIVATLQNLPNQYQTAMMVGHNSAFSQLVACFSNTRYFDRPTCVVVQILLPITQWSDIKQGIGSLEMYLTPKSI